MSNGRLTSCLRKALSEMQRSTVSGWWRIDTIFRMSLSFALTSTANAPYNQNFYRPCDKVAGECTETLEPTDANNLPMRSMRSFRDFIHN